MDKITTVTDNICRYVSFFSMLTVILLMVLVCVDIVLGNIFNRPIPGVYEMCQVILTTLVFSSWAYTQTVHGHIHVVMFVSKFPQKIRFICFAFTSLFATGVMGVACYAVFKQMLQVMKTRECTGTLMIPYWPFYIFEGVAFALLTIVLLRDAIKAVLAIGSKEFADEIQASW